MGGGLNVQGSFFQHNRTDMMTSLREVQSDWLSPRLSGWSRAHSTCGREFIKSIRARCDRVAQFSSAGSVLVELQVRGSSFCPVCLFQILLFNLKCDAFYLSHSLGMDIRHNLWVFQLRKSVTMAVFWSLSQNSLLESTQDNEKWTSIKQRGNYLSKRL